MPHEIFEAAGGPFFRSPGKEWSLDESDVSHEKLFHNSARQGKAIEGGRALQRPGQPTRPFDTRPRDRAISGQVSTTTMIRGMLRIDPLMRRPCGIHIDEPQKGRTCRDLLNEGCTHHELPTKAIQ